MSYLAEKKTELFALVDGLQEELGKVDSAEEIPELFRLWKADCWKLFEEGMKQSFTNGKLSTRTIQNGEETKPRRLAWRRGKEDDK